MDAGIWQPVEAVDGITDSQSEEFQFVLAGLPPGEHLIAIRVYDSAGNVAVSKVVLH